MLDGKVCLITGGTRGIGYEIVKLFIENKCKVVMCGSSHESAKKALIKLKNDIVFNDQDVIGYGIDLKSTESIKDVVSSVINKFGKIDILINNAGITDSKSIINITDEELYNMFEINYFGVFKLIREVSKCMMQTGGSIINTSSMVGTYGGKQQSTYASSKFAINGLTKSCAKELGKYNIRVNAVAPGVVETDMVVNNVNDKQKEMLKMMTPLGKTASPSELAGTYLYLASDLSIFTTGAIIGVDGGLIM